MAVDTEDDSTFWYTNKYIPSASGEWSTRIIKLALGSDCALWQTELPIAFSVCFFGTARYTYLLLEVPGFKVLVMEYPIFKNSGTMFFLRLVVIVEK
jgi:hypothetical protein